MQIEALKIFCDVARLRSFSHAARANGVLQSTASQAVQALEEHLGTPLVDRSCRPWKLTNEGQVFYAGCREVVDRYCALESRVRRIHSEIDSVVRVAAIYSVGLGDMSQFLQRFAARHAPAHGEIEYLHPRRVYEKVLAGQADLGIVSFPQTRRELAVIPWRVEPMTLVCSPQHRFARCQQIPLAELTGIDFVGFDRELVIRRKVDQYLKRHGIWVNVVLEFDNVEAIKRAVEVASGVSLLPRPTLEREIQSGTLVAISLAPDDLVRPLGIIHRRGKTVYRNTARLIDLLLGRANGDRGPNGESGN